jgi:glycosyltransferase involved in cell wall biosynthesis
MKISILVFDLSNNCLARTYPIGKVLEKHYEVEVIGPVFGDGIFKPYKDEFRYRIVEGKLYPLFISSISQMLKKINGDILYAFKPRFTSFGVGLLRKLISKKPLFLDIDDWEFGSYLPATKLNLIKQSILSIRKPNGLLATYSMEYLTRFADEIFVASDFLQERFGGIKLPYGPDTRIFDPNRYNRTALRKQWNLLDEKIIMFSGTPMPHKGLEDLLSAIKSLKQKKVRLMIVGGDKQNPYVQKLLDKGGNSLIVIGHQPHSRMPEFLSMADLVVLPQKKIPYTRAQIPGKIYEAMAMAKPIIATNVSDLPKILDGCGLIIEPGDVNALSEKIGYILENEKEAQILGTKAREKCIAKYGWDAMEKILIDVFEKYR